MTAVPRRRESGQNVRKIGPIWRHRESLCFAVIQFQFVLCHPGLYVRDARLQGQDSGVCLHDQDWLLETEWCSGREQRDAEYLYSEWREREQEASLVNSTTYSFKPIPRSLYRHFQAVEFYLERNDRAVEKEKKEKKKKKKKKKKKGFTVGIGELLTGEASARKREEEEQ